MEAGVSDYVVNSENTAVFTPANAADDVLVEQFNGVVFHDELSGDYAPTVLEFGSALIRIWEGQTQDFNADGTAINPLADYEVKKNVKYIPSSVFLPLSGANTPEVDLTYEDYTGDNVFDPILMDNAFVGAITAAYGSGTKVTYVTDTDAAEALNVGDVVDITDLTSAFNGTAKAITDVVVSVTNAVTEVVSDGTSFEYTAASHNFVAGDLVSVTGASSPAANVTNYLVTLVSGSGATKKFKVANTATLTDVTFTSGAAVRPAGFKVANTVASGLAVDGAGEGELEALAVGAAVFVVDVVGEREQGLGVGLGVLHREFDLKTFAFALEVDHLGMDGDLAAIKVFHELNDAAFVKEYFLAGRVLMRERDFDALVETGHGR
jgi:hypothetical protein